MSRIIATGIVVNIIIIIILIITIIIVIRFGLRSCPGLLPWHCGQHHHHHYPDHHRHCD